MDGRDRVPAGTIPRRLPIPPCLPSFVALILTVLAHATGRAQEKSIKPGINDPFQNPDVKKSEATFEGETLVIFTQRKAILNAVGLKPRRTVADIGAGTGLFAVEVGEKRQLFAVDIAEKFLDLIRARTKDAGVQYVTTVLCRPHSAELAARSIDFKQVKEEKEQALKDNCLVIFEKVTTSKTVCPAIAGYDRVVPSAVEQPLKGTKVVIDANGEPVRIELRVQCVDAGVDQLLAAQFGGFGPFSPRHLRLLLSHPG